MEFLAAAIKWQIEIFILVLAGLIAVKVLTGEINTSGLLYGRISGRKRGQDRYFSPERVQLLVLTIGASLYYLGLVLDNPNPGTFPELPESWPAAVGGSNAIYLGGKAYARWIAPRFQG
jgi:hypothetical protein